jgi:signal transduction histidine kinase
MDKKIIESLISATDGIIYLNDLLVVTESSGRIAEILGVEHESFFGSSLIDFIHKDDKDQFEVFIGALKSSGRASAQFRLVDSVHHLRIKGVAEKTEDSLGFLLLCDDITDELRNNVDLLELKKHKSIQNFVRGLANEFNNQLMKIRNYTSLTKAGITDTRLLTRLSKAELASENARLLVEKLMELAQLKKPVVQNVSVKTLLHNTLLLSLMDSRLDVTYDEYDTPWVLKVDEVEVIQALYQLFENTWEASEDHSWTRLSIRNKHITEDRDGLKAGHYVEITVDDHGIGISELDSEHLFEPYYSTHQKGRGFGLNLARSILQKQGGALFFDSEYLKGARFRVYLPADIDAEHAELEMPLILDAKAKEVAGVDFVVKEEQTKEVAPKEDVPVETSEELVLPVRELDLSNAPVIVMDDDWEIRDVVTMMLETMGYKVEQASMGEEVISYLDKNNGLAQAVILDLNVRKGMGAVATLPLVKGKYPNVKSFISTGESSSEFMQKYQESGFDGRIPKPYDYDQLENLLKKELGNG